VEKYPSLYNLVLDKINDFKDFDEMNYFEQSLLNQSKEISNKKDIDIHDVDFMTGSEFEYFIFNLFKSFGYQTFLTKGSGDQGIDVLVEKNRIKIGIQTKCYSGAVSNKAIQEVVAGMKYYKVDKGMVITNNIFTQSAMDLAKVNDIIVWDRSILIKKIEVFNDTNIL
jgi:HJR/Mrr/RecB family endonuclease